MEISWVHGSAGRLGGVVRRISCAAMDVVYPPTCLSCGMMVMRHGGLCASCWLDVRFIDRPYCEVTGVPFDHDRGEGLVSLAAIADPPVYDRARAAVLYQGAACNLVQGLKFSDRGDLAPVMARWMARAGREVVDDAEILLAVPLHGRRLFARRYNQAAELARALGGLTGKPFASGVLTRRKATKPQTGLGRTARVENLRGAFAADPRRIAHVAGRRVLLIDDVMTTGATVNAAARTLLRAGAANVCVLTFARVVSEGSETLYA